MKLTFVGGAESVTGACYLLETDTTRVLVDCGLHQGAAAEERKNARAFPFDAQSINAVFLTHAHLDHVGLLPKLYADGFRGDVYATHPTLDLARIIVEDELGLSERNAPFTERDIIECWKLTHGTHYKEKVLISDTVSVTFYNAGHILGSSMIEVRVREGERERVIVFSGDLGNAPAPFLGPPQALEQADVVVVESTYGDRVHEGRDQRRHKLMDAVVNTVSRGGVLMIPTFAIERSQELLFELNHLIEHRHIPHVPMFLDSPMAIHATAVYKKFPDYLDTEREKELLGDKNLFDFPGLDTTLTSEESKSINDVPSPKVIIAGSGMSTGGRIIHHERRYLPDPRSTLLIIGYQVRGTLGRRLLDGASTVEIFGETIAVRARIVAIGGYSAHADQTGLLRWLGNFTTHPRVFVVQGEEGPAHVFAERAHQDLALEASVPKEGISVEF